MLRPAGQSPEAREAARILALPVQGWPDDEDVEIMSYEKVRADAFARGERLFPGQVYALREWENVFGGFVPLSVGAGKAGTALMVAQDALNRGLARRVLLLWPVHLVPGLATRHLPEWRRRVNLPAAIHHFTGLSPARRARLATSGAPGIYVFPYSLLSTSDSLDLLKAVDADLVVADEAHRLKNRKSACTRRFLHWFRERPAAPHLVVLSGTMMKKSIMEYHHLIDAALRDSSPLPRSASQAFAWSLTLDSGAEPPAGLTSSTLGPLMKWAGEDDPRRAFRKRLVTAPGVAASSDERPKASLSVEFVDPGAPTEKLTALMRQVAETYVTPEGEPIDHAMHGYKWLSELSAGFYNSLVWPTPAELVESRRLTRPVTLEEAASMLQRAGAHHEAQKEYHKALKDFFDDAPPGLETPREAGRAIAAGRVTGKVADLWRTVRDLDFPDRPERRSVPVRVDDYKVRAAVEWALRLPEGRGGIIWVYHREMGEWVHEALTALGIPALYCPAGADVLIESVGDPVQGGKGDKVVVASIGAHREGRNLQAFQHQLFLQWPRSAEFAEQAIGRTHRSGQEADELVVHVLSGPEWDKVNYAACLSDSVVVQRTMGALRRVLYCDYPVLPTIYPPDFLAERGAAPERLSREEVAWLAERFGNVGDAARASS